MSNTVSTNLLLEHATRAALASLQPALVNLSQFFTIQPLTLNATSAHCYVPKVTSLPACETATTDFQSGNAVIDSVEVSPILICQKFHINPGDGIAPETILPSAVRQFSSKILEQVIAVLTVSNFGAAVASIPAASFGTGDLPAIAASIRSPSRTLLLDCGHYARLSAPFSGQFGIVGFSAVGECDFSSSVESVVGFVSTPESVVLAVGLPLRSEAAKATVGTKIVTIEQLGISVELTSWLDHATGFDHFALSCYCGVAVGQAASGKLITSS